MLAEIAGAMHDIGNAINRNNHVEYGAILAYSLLEKMKMPLEDRIKICYGIYLIVKIFLSGSEKVSYENTSPATIETTIPISVRIKSFIIHL